MNNKGYIQTPKKYGIVCMLYIEPKYNNGHFGKFRQVKTQFIPTHTKKFAKTSSNYSSYKIKSYKPILLKTIYLNVNLVK